MTAKVKVLTAEPGTELTWASKLLGLTISTRRFLLSPAGGGTLMLQDDTYRGLANGRRAVTVTTRIQEAFVAINQAAKQQAESRPRTPGQG